ncbi:hypothetical protein EV121DRAFT_197757 [Schizophyllum commune]
MVAKINELPVEVLLLIFEQYTLDIRPQSPFDLFSYPRDALPLDVGTVRCLPYCGAIVLQAVCRQWKMAAESPSLWTVLYLDRPSDNKMRQLTVFLDRAKQLPISLTLRQSSEMNAASISLFVSILTDERYVWRWEELLLTICSEQPGPTCKALARIFSEAGSSTNLERFALRVGTLDSTGTFWRPSLPMMLTDVWTAALSNVSSLKAIDTGALSLFRTVLCMSDSWGQLRHLVTDCGFYGVVESNSPLPSLLTLLRACPRLEVLHIFQLGWDSADRELREHGPVPIVSAHIHTFRAQMCKIPPRFAELVCMPALRRLELIDSCDFESISLCKWLHLSQARLRMLYLRQTSLYGLSDAVDYVNMDILRELRVLCVQWRPEGSPEADLGSYIDACRSQFVTGYLDFKHAIDAYLEDETHSYEYE